MENEVPRTGVTRCKDEPDAISDWLAVDRDALLDLRLLAGQRSIGNTWANSLAWAPETLSRAGSA